MRAKKKLSKNYMDNIPEHAPGLPWHTRRDGMAEIDIEHKGFYHFLAQKIWKKPRVSHIALEKYGTLVWNSMDGKNTVYDIVQIMEREFPDEKDRMLDRVVTYIATLQRGGFITVREGRNAFADEA